MEDRQKNWINGVDKHIDHVSAQVDAEDGNSSQRKRNAGKDEEEEGWNLWDVAGQCVCNGLLQVVKNETTCRNMQETWLLKICV